MHTNPDEYQILIREPSGPRPLCRATDTGSKPRIWNCNVGVVSFRTQPGDQIARGRENCNLDCSGPTECVITSTPQLPISSSCPTGIAVDTKR